MNVCREIEKDGVWVWFGLVWLGINYKLLMRTEDRVSLLRCVRTNKKKGIKNTKNKNKEKLFAFKGVCLE